MQPRRRVNMNIAALASFALLLSLHAVGAHFPCPLRSLENPLRMYSHRHCNKYHVCLGLEQTPREVDCLFADWVYHPTKFMCVPLPKGANVHEINPGCIPRVAVSELDHDPNGVALPILQDYEW